MLIIFMFWWKSNIRKSKSRSNITILYLVRHVCTRLVHWTEVHWEKFKLVPFSEKLLSIASNANDQNLLLILLSITVAVHFVGSDRDFKIYGILVSLSDIDDTLVWCLHIRANVGTSLFILHLVFHNNIRTRIIT